MEKEIKITVSPYTARDMIAFILKSGGCKISGKAYGDGIGEIFIKYNQNPIEFKPQQIKVEIPDSLKTNDNTN